MKDNQDKQSPHWADKVVQDVIEWQSKNPKLDLHVDDMKTPSGRVHTGALRGVVLHDVVAKVIAENNQRVVSTYVFNDMDPMDGLPSYLDQKEFEQHMGKPLFKIPRPELTNSGLNLHNIDADDLAELEGTKTVAELYATDFKQAFRRIGCDQEIVWSHHLYESGKMDNVIKIALDNKDEIIKIYKEVADYELPDDWYPFQVICEECGKVGTTTTVDWDGEKVSYQCEKNKVEWAVGCGHQGSVSPFGGTGKLLWKVDWPAHWTTMGVTVEGAGKDHTSAGGSRDMANAFCQKIFKIVAPFDIPYEWILVRGAKMSSSKGVGTSAREFLSLFPSEIARFLFLNKDYNQVIDFDPIGMAIPDLFDDYDQGARIFWEQEIGDLRQARAFELSSISELMSPQFLPRFRDIAVWMQYPEIDLVEKFEEIKGDKLSEAELETLSRRKRYAEIWVENYAPDEYRFIPSEDLPKLAEKLSTEERQFVIRIIEDSFNAEDAESFQQQIFQIAKDTVGARQGFQAIYTTLIGKKSGPRAAWLLLSLDEKLRKSRIEALKSGKSKDVTEDDNSFKFPILDGNKYLSISDEVKREYPSINLGFAVIKGVSIEKTNPDLEIEKQELVNELSNLSAKSLGELPEIKSYRELYRSMRVDWHSRRPSPEALLRRVAKGQDLYTVNTCVDAYNLVVMKNRVSVGAFDFDKFKFPTQLVIGNGTEEILLLGNDEPTKIKQGELFYQDGNGAYNLDFNYRDAQRTAVTESTKNLIINIDGVNSISRQQVEKTLAETIAIITKYCGGTVELAGIISAQE